jgi:hypothetical protein
MSVIISNAIGECPNCKNYSVIKEKIYGGFFKNVYRYTAYDCSVCGKYHKIVDETLLWYNHPEVLGAIDEIIDKFKENVKKRNS